MGKEWIYIPSTGSPVVPFSNTYSASFDGVDAFINWPGILSSNYENSSTEFSYSVWFNLGDFELPEEEGYLWFPIFTQSGWTEGAEILHDIYFYFEAETQSPAIGLEFFKDEYESSLNSWAITNVFKPNQWQHLVITFKPGNIVKMYLDGVELDNVEVDDPTGWVPPVYNPANIECNLGRQWDGFYSGILGDFSKWPFALNQNEINEILGSGLEGDLSQHSRWNDFKDDPRSLWVTWEDPDSLAVGGKVHDRTENAYEGDPINMIADDRVEETAFVNL